MEDSPLILPGDPEFNFTLSTALPPDWIAAAERIGQQCVFVCEPGSGLMRPASNEELTEYLYGGEYDERLEELQSEQEDDLELIL
jgi:hypothetical protein